MKAHKVECPACGGEGTVEVECSRCRRPDCGEVKSCEVCSGRGWDFCDEADCDVCAEIEATARGLVEQASGG